MIKRNKIQEKKLPKIVVIVGPTAVGKSELAIKLAKKFNGEIISADSRQVYRGIDLATGKVTKKEMEGIKHYLLDLVSLRTIFTVAKFKQLAHQAIKEILNKNKLPIICGGTPFYIDALIYNIDIPPIKPDFKLRRKLEKMPTNKLFEKLKELDARRAANIDRFNRRRLIRALEILIKSGKKIKPLKRELLFNVLKIGVIRPSEELRKRIEKRLLKRLKKGMVGEIRRVHQQGISWKRLYDLGLECRYISLYLRKKITYPEMVGMLKKEIWHFAKRQMTWWKRDKTIHWLSNFRKANVLIREFLK